MAKIDLVFRQVGERTADVALDLAIKNIQPDAVHIMDNIQPFSECVNQMLRIRHDCDYVVYVDADCLILENMRGFIERCRTAYVDSFVSDQFRGRLHCGVHITRADLVRYMSQVDIPADDLAYVLRPESRIRGIAMRAAMMSKQFRNFDILHDHFQYYRHVFAKYALRELRSRKEELPHLTMAMQRWPQTSDTVDDFTIARHAIDYARHHCPADRSAEEVDRFIQDLPHHAEQELSRLGVQEKGTFTHDHLKEWLEQNTQRRRFGTNAQRSKVFGIGLSRTGTRSLNRALQTLGFDPLHYPLDHDTYSEMAHGQYDLTMLKYHDGITDITVSAFYAQLDQAYPGSKFILTVRDKESWLNSCENHWRNSSAFDDSADPEQKRLIEIRRFFRATTFGCYDFQPERFVWVYEQHLRAVTEYFRDRPDQLLIMDVCAGDGFEKLAPFMGCDMPCAAFPHTGSAVSQAVAAVRASEAELTRRLHVEKCSTIAA